MPEKNGTIVDAKGRQKRSWRYVKRGDCITNPIYAEYAIRCHKDGKRKFTHKLTKQDALMFKKTAQHLVKYLSKEYGV